MESMNPTFRDQAVANGYFPKITGSNPLFTEYGIQFIDVESDAKILKGMMDTTCYTNNDLGNTVCKITYSSRCKLIPVRETEQWVFIRRASDIECDFENFNPDIDLEERPIYANNAYDLVDASSGDILIRAWFDVESEIYKDKATKIKIKHSLKYKLFK